MNYTDSISTNSTETAPNNTPRVIYRGDSGYNRQLATQIIELSTTPYADNNRPVNPLDPVSLNSINTESIGSINSTISPRSYDPESNSFIHTDARGLASRWFAQTASRMSSNPRGQSNSDSSGQVFIMRNYPFLKESGFNLQIVLKKNYRRMLVVVLFTLIILTGYAFSFKLVEALDKRVARKFTAMPNSTQTSFKNVVSSQDLNQVIDELRMEIQKLKETSYKNSVAINGLSNGLYKVPGSEDDSESAKKTKFGKTNNTVNLSKTIHRQDLKSPKRRQENSDFVPGTIAYDASITLQS
ncbi:conserved hypothetical protein [Theileria orientalis strain Shintoku]|uniref:Uncharacterized protein n=1 Tax=Theileria orientalis strain Shintoku TaxID=869250 RepID=J4DNF4_THEOR|nr:conserved hypothetical protein [Theileria orientalis strain Shintoku]BAM38864.1 conserved hypothetical protein [Theileria orientalis strain Shintoku]|eukprot:XP_009689165.1 conserved hypothetical protein [Theileria orientalis strain Shintoku]